MIPYKIDIDFTVFTYINNFKSDLSYLYAKNKFQWNIKKNWGWTCSLWNLYLFAKEMRLFAEPDVQHHFVSGKTFA